MLYSIITSSYNSGEGLLKTVRSVLAQTGLKAASEEQGTEGYAAEILVQDAGSTDDSVEKLLQEEDVKTAINRGILKLTAERDKGVYDGMNKALERAAGEYVLFLNCGDTFHDTEVLRKVTGFIAAASLEKTEDEAGSGQKMPCIFYGNTYCINRKAVDASPRVVDGFTCYRNIPCHQSCFYDRRLFAEKKYDLQYRIRADYDHFLWCFYKAHADMHYMDLVIADYEGGGISETKENRKRDRQEHKAITEAYIPAKELKKYRRTMMLTLAPLRRVLAESKAFSGIYHGIKKAVYDRRQNKKQ